MNKQDFYTEYKIADSIHPAAYTLSNALRDIYPDLPDAVPVDITNEGFLPAGKYNLKIKSLTARAISDIEKYKEEKQRLNDFLKWFYGTKLDNNLNLALNPIVKRMAARMAVIEGALSDNAAALNNKITLSKNEIQEIKRSNAENVAGLDIGAAPLVWLTLAGLGLGATGYLGKQYTDYKAQDYDMETARGAQERRTGGLDEASVQAYIKERDAHSPTLSPAKKEAEINELKKSFFYQAADAAGKTFDSIGKNALYIMGGLAALFFFMNKKRK